MKKMITLLLVITLFLTGCEKPVEELDCELYPTHVDCLEPEIPKDPDPEPEVPLDLNFLDIYYMNDFHGAILEDGDSIGLEGIGNYINSRREAYPDNVLVISGGDMLQGSALSNYFNGLSTIDLMDEIGFDAMALGNHEFDWGLETVTQYFDEDESNGEANFPLLGANVFYEGTTTRPDHIDPYIVVEKGDLKIGIIGTIGFGLEYSIATNKVEGYEFAYPVPIIEEHAITLRKDLGCDIVIWVGHDKGDYNEDIANLSGDAKIDALFNAHSHSDYANRYLGVPSVQSGSKGEFLGYVRLNLTEENTITSFDADNLSKYESAYFIQEYLPIKNMVDGYKSETDELFSTAVIDTASFYNTTNLSRWMAKLMRVAAEADIGFQNYGGTRAPIESNTITYATLYEIWPFDNVVKTVYLKGSVINSLKSSGLAYDTEIDTFIDDQLYKVATNDYIFDKTTNPFLEGEQIENTGLLQRELAHSEMILQSAVFDKFNIENEIQTGKSN